MTILEALKQLRNDLKLWVTNNLNVKVDKEDGKDLSTNNFVDGEQIRMSNLYGTIPAGTVFYEMKTTLSPLTVGTTEKPAVLLEDAKTVSIINNDNYFIEGNTYVLTVNGTDYTCSSVWWAGVEYGADGTTAYGDIGFRDENDNLMFMLSAAGNGTSENPYNLLLVVWNDIEGLSVGDTIDIKISCQSDLTIKVPNEYVDISVDAELSSTSTNAVQNQAVNAAISELSNLVGDTSVSSQIGSALNSYVVKEDGKELSRNSFVDGEQIRMSHLYGAIPAGTVFYEGKIELLDSGSTDNPLYGITYDTKMVAVTNNNNYFIDGYPYTITVGDQEYNCEDAGWASNLIDSYMDGIGLLLLKDASGTLKGNLAMSNIEDHGRDMILQLKDTSAFSVGDIVTVKISCQNDLNIKVPSEYLDTSSIVNAVIAALPSAEEASF